MDKFLIFCIALAFFGELASCSARAEQPALQVVIGIDMSDDNPLLTDPKFSKKFARFGADFIAALPTRSKIFAVTFGNGKPGDQVTLVKPQELTYRNPSTRWAKRFSKKAKKLRYMVADQEIAPQEQSRILSFIYDQTQQYGCANTQLLIATDGLNYADGGGVESNAYHLIKQRKGELKPTPSAAGCDITLVGVGIGHSPVVADKLIDLWGRWAAASGASIRILRDING